MRRSHALFVCVALICVSTANPLPAQVSTHLESVDQRGPGNLPLVPPAAILVPELPAAAASLRDSEPLQLELPPQPEITFDISGTESTGSLPPNPVLANPVLASPVLESPTESTPTEAAPLAAEASLAATTVPQEPPTTAAQATEHAVPTQVFTPAEPIEQAPAFATSDIVVTLPTVPLPDLPVIIVQETSVPGLATADIADIIARQIDTVLAGVARLPEKDRRDLAQAYAARDNRPLWIGPDGWSAAGKGIVARLANAADDALALADYPVPEFASHDPASLATADIRLSALAVLYARDARGARLDPRRLSKLLTPKLTIPTAGDVVAALSAGGDTKAVLGAYNPSHAGYRALRAKLIELRQDAEPAAPLVAIPQGPALRIGMRDERIPLVRARLGLGPTVEPVFDRSVAVAVSDFQKSAGLPANGILGSQTLAAMGSMATTRLEADLAAQMERWRWLPPGLGESHVIVNIPEFMVRVVIDGSLAHQARTIVGKPETPTPVFSDTMDHVVINPSWFVPPSILKKEFLPKLATDPDYAAKRGFEVVRRGNSISVRQPPGERNALGHIKFMFPNDHAVYLHDTPSRNLFGSTRRAFSHGCVRVDQPFKLAEAIMGRGAGWTEARIRALVGGGERSVKLAQPLPVHLTYMTHVMNDAGDLVIHDDLYGFHALVRGALAQFGRSARF